MFPNDGTQYHDDYNLFNLTATYDFGAIRLLSSTSYTRAQQNYTAYYALSDVSNFPDSQVDKTTAQSNTLVGDKLDYIADYSYSVGAGYRFNWANGTPGALHVDYNVRDKLNYLNRTLAPAGAMQSDRVALLNACGGAEWERWTLELYGENLLDESGDLDPWGPLHFGAHYQPRTVGVRIGLNYK
ncbi:MAG: hypothetical protein ABI885_14745 [Gammaproteobacteria bacterium]